MPSRDKARFRLATTKNGRTSLVDCFEIGDETPTPDPIALWVVGQNRTPDGKEWEFQGVFDSKDKAVKACRNDSYWAAEVRLNESLPDETVDAWRSFSFPTVQRAWTEYNAALGLPPEPNPA